MSNNYVATRDGVLLKVGNEIRSLYRDAPVPQGADADHVQLLKDRGLLVRAEEADTDDAQDGAPAKSASRADWDAYATSQGLSDDEIAAFSSKEELQKHFGVE